MVALESVLFGVRVWKVVNSGIALITCLRCVLLERNEVIETHILRRLACWLPCKHTCCCIVRIAGPYVVAPWCTALHYIALVNQPCGKGAFHLRQ